MEPWLRAYARKRREEAGKSFALQDSARRLLQAEVRLQYGQTRNSPRSWWHTLVLFWPRIGFALGLMVVLSVTLMIFLRTEGDQAEMAKFIPPTETNTVLPLAKVDSLPAAPAEALPAESASESKRQLLVKKSVGIEKKAPERFYITRETYPESESLSLGRNTEAATIEAATVEAAAARPVTSTLALVQSVQPRRETAPAPPEAPQSLNKLSRARAASPARIAVVEEKALNLAEPQVQSIPSTTALALAGPVPDETVRALSQAVALSSTAMPSQYRFQRVAAAQTSKTKVPMEPALPVLTRFELEQVGDTVRILDADGSVYEGRNETITNTIPFSVRGTNRTLNRILVFSGTLQLAPTGPRLEKASAQQLSPGEEAWMLIGTIQVGPEEVWQIQARQDKR